MPLRLVACWQAVKWLLAVLLAGLLTLGPASYLMHHTGVVDLHHLTWFQYWVKLLALPSLAFGLFVWLACTLVATHKKYAGLLVIGLTLLFIGLGSYQHTLGDGWLETQYLVRYAGFLVGLGIGFARAQQVFQGPRWGPS